MFTHMSKLEISKVMQGSSLAAAGQQLRHVKVVAVFIKAFVRFQFKGKGMNACRQTLFPFRRRD